MNKTAFRFSRLLASLPKVLVGIALLRGRITPARPGTALGDKPTRIRDLTPLSLAIPGRLLAPDHA